MVNVFVEIFEVSSPSTTTTNSPRQFFELSENLYSRRGSLYELKAKSWSTYIPGALVVVILGVVANQFLLGSLRISGKHLVEVPQLSTLAQFKTIFKSPDWTQLGSTKVWVVALTIAIVGSLETLLSLEATDKLDPIKHKTNPHKELKAQGIGNLVSGLIGGLPITQVIVRSSANIAAGGQSKLSAIVHGFLLLFSILFLRS